MHIGALRSPVRTPAQATELARQILRREEFSLVGLMAYEGQVAGVPTPDDCAGLWCAA